MGSDEPVAGSIVRCEVVLGAQGKILFPLAFASQVEFNFMPLSARNTILPILEVRPL